MPAPHLPLRLGGALALLLSIGAAAEAPDLSGDWFTEGIEDGQQAQFIHHRRSGGEFTVEIRALDGCRPIDQWVEAGTWRQVDDRIEQTTSLVQGKHVDFHDVYVVHWESATAYSEYDPSTNLTWQEIRVPPDFTFPTPRQCATS